MHRDEDQDDTFTIDDAHCAWEGDKALRIVSADFTGFVPQSVIHDDSEVWKKGQRGKLIVKFWWADANGLV